MLSTLFTFDIVLLSLLSIVIIEVVVIAYFKSKWYVSPEFRAGKYRGVTDEPRPDSQDQWRDIASAPHASTVNNASKMFVVIALNCPVNNGNNTYTSDPWCVWRKKDGSFGRWPHDFQPTHWMPLPSPPKEKQL